MRISRTVKGLFYLLALSTQATTGASIASASIEEVLSQPRIYHQVLSFLEPQKGLDLQAIQNLAVASKSIGEIIEAHHVHLNMYKGYNRWIGCHSQYGVPSAVLTYTANEALNRLIRYMGHVLYTKYYESSIRPEDQIMRRDSAEFNHTFAQRYFPKTLLNYLPPLKVVQTFCHQLDMRINVPFSEDGTNLRRFAPFNMDSFNECLELSADAGNRMAFQLLALGKVWRPYLSTVPIYKVRLEESRLSDEEAILALTDALQAIPSTTDMHGDTKDYTEVPINYHEIALQHLILHLAATGRLGLIHSIITDAGVSSYAKQIYANTLFDVGAYEMLNAFHINFQVNPLLLRLLELNSNEDLHGALTAYKTKKQPFPEIDIQLLVHLLCPTDDRELYYHASSRKGARDGRTFSSFAFGQNVEYDSYANNTARWLVNTVRDSLLRKGDTVSKDDIKAVIQLLDRHNVPYTNGERAHYWDHYIFICGGMEALTNEELRHAGQAYMVCLDRQISAAAVYEVLIHRLTRSPQDLLEALRAYKELENYERAAEIGELYFNTLETPTLEDIKEVTKMYVWANTPLKAKAIWDDHLHKLTVEADEYVLRAAINTYLHSEDYPTAASLADLYLAKHNLRVDALDFYTVDLNGSMKDLYFFNMPGDFAKIYEKYVDVFGDRVVPEFILKAACFAGVCGAYENAARLYGTYLNKVGEAACAQDVLNAAYSAKKAEDYIAAATLYDRYLDMVNQEAKDIVFADVIDAHRHLVNPVVLAARRAWDEVDIPRAIELMISAFEHRSRVKALEKRIYMPIVRRDRENNIL